MITQNHDRNMRIVVVVGDCPDDFKYSQYGDICDKDIYGMWRGRPCQILAKSTELKSLADELKKGDVISVEGDAWYGNEFLAIMPYKINVVSKKTATIAKILNKTLWRLIK